MFFVWVLFEKSFMTYAILHIEYKENQRLNCLHKNQKIKLIRYEKFEVHDFIAYRDFSEL